MIHSDREFAVNVIFDDFTKEELQSEETQQARAKLLAMSDEEFSAACLRVAQAIVARHSPLRNMFSSSKDINVQELYRFPMKGQ